MEQQKKVLSFGKFDHAAMPGVNRALAVRQKFA
jgi:hypothetical protein